MGALGKKLLIGLTLTALTLPLIAGTAGASLREAPKEMALEAMDAEACERLLAEHAPELLAADGACYAGSDATGPQFMFCSLAFPLPAPYGGGVDCVFIGRTGYVFCYYYLNDVSRVICPWDTGYYGHWFCLWVTSWRTCY